ncbi:hypothetical protein AVEN_240100-1 [Araneus ventricosus]|uniref:Uncharacterized protein n=1 Tax=Araneus ventricosus TaxID=182803 RepID=A0A4Y2NHE9_ARAVE|nr:hypothetical protein AVEN_240100-1 [Araneus ventricosus]
MMHSVSRQFYSQMKPALRDKACSTRTMRICGRPKILTSLSRRTCNTSLVLTSGQGFSEIICWGRTFCPNASMAQSTLFSYSTSSRIFCREYRPLCERTCGSCMMVDQHIFRLRCVTTSMLHIPGDGLDGSDLLLGLHVLRTSIPWIAFLGPHEIACLSDACGYCGGSRSTDRRRCRRHRQRTGYV